MENFDTIDETASGKIPNEAILEMKSMCKWMTFSGVMLIIIGLLAVLGFLSNPESNPNGAIGLIMQVVTVIMGFILVRKSSQFNKYANLHEEADLVAALKSNQIFWIISNVLFLISFLSNFLAR